MKNIFCLEGDWESKVKSNLSIKSTLDFLQATHSNLQVYFKNCVTTSELEARLKILKRNKSFDIVVFAYHGEKSKIQLGVDDLHLDELAQLAGNSLKNKVVHFGSCKTTIDVEEVAKFRRKTRCKAVSGYEKNVDFFESSVFDLIYLNGLQQYTRLGYLWNYLENNYSAQLNRLGFHIDYTDKTLIY